MSLTVSTVRAPHGETRRRDPAREARRANAAQAAVVEQPAPTFEATQAAEPATASATAQAATPATAQQATADAPRARENEPAGSIAQLQQRASSFAQRHPRAVACGAAGLALAVLILLIGFWPTALIALLVGVGVAIGDYRDGDVALQRFATQALGRIKN